VFTHQRKSVDLNGTWKFNPDPYQRCKQQQWWRHLGTDKSFFPCWDPEGLWDIQVPGTWKTQFEELKWYDGDANYVKDFEIDELEPDEEAFLIFDGVVYQADVYLNGHHVARHEHGYSPFRCRVTEYLRKSNRLFVLVDNKLSADRVPGVRFDWNNDGGIINGVKLVVVPAVHIENFRTWTRIDSATNEAVIGVEAWLSARDLKARERVRFSIPALEVSAEFEVGVGAAAGAEVRVGLDKIRLWSPEDPKLYRTTLASRYETLEDEVGYREVRTEGHAVMLNGQPVRFYGICVHSEFPGTGRTATAEGIDAMVAKIKELGCNFVRCAHYPYAEMWGRAMDRAGLMWWEEVPVYWLPTIQRPDMTAKALGMLQDTIVRDWNRASLVIWSVSNECAGDAGFSFDLEGGNYPYWVKACGLVRKMDPSRLISSADSGYRRTMDAGWTPDKADAFDTNFSDAKWLPAHPDAFYELLDVLSGNVYVTGEGDGLTAYHKFADMLRRYNKPMMVSEFGFMSLRGSDDLAGVNGSSLGSEARHVRVLREAYQSFGQLPEISGYMPWCLMDVRVPMHWRWYNAGKAVFRYGLLDENWTPKKAFAVVREETAKLIRQFGQWSVGRSASQPKVEVKVSSGDTGKASRAPARV
jgi:beta-glucuronidase